MQRRTKLDYLFDYRLSDWLNDLILCYIEKEFFRGLDPKKIKKTFQSINDRKDEFTTIKAA